MQGFKLFNSYFGRLIDDGEGTVIYGFENFTPDRPTPREFHVPSDGGCWGYVHSGSIELNPAGAKYSITVPEGFWFSTPAGFVAKAETWAGNFRVAVWQRTGYKGTLSMGQWEPEGRLKYIDGCKDSILYAPIKKGDPCLNALYMPEGINQTMHTHPSTRSGFIIVGGAVCETPAGKNEIEQHHLRTGQIFYLKTDQLHKFRSDHGQDVTMKLIAYHPDSDFGPEDENHPMLNRTIVEGVSASLMPEIRTK